MTPGPPGHAQKFSVASAAPVHNERFLGLSKAQTLATPIFPPSKSFKWKSTLTGSLIAISTSSSGIALWAMIVPRTGVPPPPLVMLIPTLPGVAVSNERQRRDRDTVARRSCS